jgi:fluoroacetyl-CoA thioesterase
VELQIPVGVKGEAMCLVNEENTAEKFASGAVPVFGTPALVALIEQAAINALLSYIPEGYTTVGTRIDLEHLAASPLGMKINAVAKLTEIDGRRLIFKAEAFDDIEKVGEAIHVRFAVNLERFVEKAKSKQ